MPGLPSPSGSEHHCWLPHASHPGHRQRRKSPASHCASGSPAESRKGQFIQRKENSLLFCLLFVFFKPRGVVRVQSTQRDFYFFYFCVGLEDETSCEKIFLTHTGNMHVLMPKAKILQLCAQGEMLPPATTLLFIYLIFTIPCSSMILEPQNEVVTVLS